MLGPPVERYARCSITIDSITIEPGLQYERGEDAQAMSVQLRDVVRRAMNSIRIELTRVPFDCLSSDIESEIVKTWPGRAYFVEVHSDDGCWTQVFQPFGVPRNA